MHKITQGFLFRALILATLVGVSLGYAKDPDNPSGRKEKNQLYKGAGTPRYAVLNINNLHAWHRSDGLSNHSPASDNGLYFPRFSSWAIYQDGMLYGGKPYQNAAKTIPAPLGQPIRVGGAHYATGTVEGWVTGDGPTAVQVSSNDTRARIYRIRRDYASLINADGSYTEELRRDAAEVNEIAIGAVTDGHMAAVYAQYETDWTEWPTDLGAPYIDRNGNGQYDAPPMFTLGDPIDKSDDFTVDSLIALGHDEPGVAGSDLNSPADQVIWTVYNDLNRTQTTGLTRVRSEPLGLEIQKTVWGYKRTDAMGNLYFQRWKLINKGGVDVDGAGTKGSFYLDSMYVCQWSDPDLGNAGDDLIGCDTLLSMGFVYNGGAVDQEYQKYGLAPPAAGYDFLAGPIVASPGDTAVFNLQYRVGFRNLPMTSFAYFSAGSPYSDPPNNYTQGTSQWYKMMRGYAPVDGADVPYNFPPATGPSKFVLSGDPVRQTGWVDGLGTQYSFPPGDRRLLLNTGPFEMAPGDTQEITTGVVVGLGSDRKSSVGALKFYDRFAQNTFNALFAVPKSPDAPDVKIAELDGQIVLEWGSNLTRVADTEGKVNLPGVYAFEGYVVYQLPSNSSSLSDGIRVATFDLPSDPAVVLDEQFDNESGLVLFKPVQFGSNSGINRTFVFDRDYLRDIDKLYNGQEYYLAVTAYAVAQQSGFLPAQLESSPTIYTVRPQVPFGTTPIVDVNTGLTVSAVSGIGDVPITVEVLDPTAVTGQTYSIGWSTQPDRFSGSTDITFDPLGNPVSVLSASLVLNETGTALDYTVDLSVIADLAGPVIGIYFDTTDTFGYKNLPYTVTLGNAQATGTWSSADGTLPFTAGIRQALLTDGLYVTVISDVDTTAAFDDTVQAQISFDTHPYTVTRGGQTILTYQGNYSEDNDYPIFDGLRLKVGSPVFKLPPSYTSWTQTAGDGNSATFYTGFGTTYDAIFPQSSPTTTVNDLVSNLEFRFTGVRATRTDGTFPEDTVIVSGGSIATVRSNDGSTVVRLRIPFELWEVDPGTGRNRQINVVARDRNADAASPWGNGGAPLWMRMSSAGRAYFGSVSTDYTADETAAGITAVPIDNPKGTWFFATGVTAGTTPQWRTGDVVEVVVPNPTVPGTDVWSFTAPAPVVADQTAAKASAENIGVFPNPYYGFNPAETSRFSKFVTFNYLPTKATIRIFNLAGQLVRTLDKDDTSQFMRWNLLNQYNFPVASGMYIAHVDMPDLGTSKVLKLAIIQEQEVLDVY